MIQRTNRSIPISLFVGGLLFFAPTAWSLIDMRNANYTNTWTDYEKLGTGFPLQVNRTYNSRSLMNGIFGFGWCSDFETKLSLKADGKPVVTECGDGQTLVYSTRKSTEKDLVDLNSKILEQAKKSGRFDRRTLDQMSKDLEENAQTRDRLASEFQVFQPLKEGTKYFANGLETESIVFNNGVYTRSISDGSSQRFNKDGRLTHLYDKNGNFIRFEYDKSQIREVIDSNGSRLRFTYYPSGKVRQITGQNNVTIEYKYRNNEDLIFVNNAWGNKLNYEYDDLHNLTKATYPDGTLIAIQYDKKNDWVIGFTDRKKCQENYTYEFNPKNPDLHYWSSVKKTCNNKVMADSRHEFFYRKVPGGTVALDKVFSTINGVKTEIHYHEEFNRPIRITRGNVTNAYTYFPNGQVQSKENNLGRLTYKYDEKTQKVLEVVAFSFGEKKKLVKTTNSSFRWDNKGNLTEAWNSDGQRIKMAHDEKGRTIRMEDQAKKYITLQYDEKTSLPNLITRPGFGSVKISYKPNGDMDQFESPQGANTGLQIVMILRNYYDVTAPATAELYN
ncbi:MAG: DUF6531 domain-containing protein [Bdellovibrio sp.]